MRQLKRVMIRDYKKNEMDSLKMDTHDISVKGGRYEIHCFDEDIRVVVRCYEFSSTWFYCRSLGYVWCYAGVG